ncbi:CBM9 family sugar-binding protein [Colwellia sp. E2M01]|uniref:CBM9 family sugar-binding protein n=1 Tax=Colwellia sp. E2M01 TaxID=2841561 RepID=UPI001C08F01A|nr:CBM9 family sugar-binding protein [Colwellia sp. E2M01]MBU2871127.1 CBM9 family sugar-binding protein [Colwellia sp. E2M01]
MANYFKLLTTVLMLISLNTLAIEAKKANEPIKIDGIATDASWLLAKWHPIDNIILGKDLTPEDFSGKYKIMWDEQQLYLLVEITDDVLFDQHADPRHLYWDDDALEIFIDADASGGNHQFNFNAFAYHIALDNQAVDIGEKNADGSNNFVLLNDHITSKWQRSENPPYNVVWEVAVRLYDDSFTMSDKKTQPMKLFTGKKVGFMLAYCDNDGSKEREHFIGSTDIKAVNGDKNLGYITADVFQHIILKN